MRKRRERTKDAIRTERMNRMSNDLACEVWTDNSGSIEKGNKLLNKAGGKDKRVEVLKRQKQAENKRAKRIQ